MADYCYGRGRKKRIFLTEAEAIEWINTTEFGWDNEWYYDKHCNHIHMRSISKRRTKNTRHQRERKKRKRERERNVKSSS